MCFLVEASRDSVARRKGKNRREIEKLRSMYARQEQTLYWQCMFLSSHALFLVRGFDMEVCRERSHIDDESTA